MIDNRTDKNIANVGSSSNDAIKRVDEEKDTRDLIHNSFFFITYEWAQEARVLYNSTQERLARDKYSSLLSPFISNEENEGL
jgi:hypothetical protein